MARPASQIDEKPVVQLYVERKRDEGLAVFYAAFGVERNKDRIQRATASKEKRERPVDGK